MRIFDLLELNKNLDQEISGKPPEGEAVLGQSADAFAQVLAEVNTPQPTGTFLDKDPIEPPDQDVEEFLSTLPGTPVAQSEGSALPLTEDDETAWELFPGLPEDTPPVIVAAPAEIAETSVEKFKRLAADGERDIFGQYKKAIDTAISSAQDPYEIINYIEKNGTEEEKEYLDDLRAYVAKEITKEIFETPENNPTDEAPVVTSEQGVIPVVEAAAAEPAISSNEVGAENIVLSTADWFSGRRPEGYQSTSAMHDELKKKKFSSVDVLGQAKAAKWNELLDKAYHGGLTAQESDEIVALSREYNANARKLLESQTEEIQPATPANVDEATPVVATPVEERPGGVTEQAAPLDQRTAQQKKFDEWNSRHGISVEKGEETEDKARFNAANKLIFGRELTDDDLSALTEEDIIDFSDPSKTEALLKRKKEIGKKTPAADNGEPLPAEKEFDNGIIKAEIEGLTENYLVDARKNIEENDSLPGPVKKALLASIDSRIRKSELRGNLVDKEVALAESQKSLAEYNRNIARLKRALGMAKFALIGAALVGGLGATFGAEGWSYLLGAGGLVAGGFSYEWFSKERRTLNVQIAQAEKTMVQADIKVEDVKEAKNKGEIDDLEAFMRLSAWVKAKEFGQETSVMQKEFNSILDLPGLRTALGYK